MRTRKQRLLRDGPEWLRGRLKEKKTEGEEETGEVQNKLLDNAWGHRTVLYLSVETDKLCQFCVHCKFAYCYITAAAPQWRVFWIFLMNGSCHQSNKVGMMSIIDNSGIVYEEAWKQANVLLNYGFNKSFITLSALFFAPTCFTPLHVSASPSFPKHVTQ